jgi:Glycosyltransferase family 87
MADADQESLSHVGRNFSSGTVLSRWLREAYALLAFPIGAALMALGLVRLLLSAARSCRELACDDFGRFWYATSAWVHTGQSLYAPTPASYADDGLLYSNLNLPHTHLAFLPFTYLPRDAAAAAWLLVGLIAIAATARVVAAETGWRPTAAWVLVFIWWMPTHVQVVTGQVAWMMMPLIALGWRSARRGAWPLSGLAIGIAIAIKPFLMPLLVWLIWRRRWKAGAIAIGAMLATVLAGVVVFGAPAYQEWTGATGVVDWYSRSLNASLWGAGYRLFTQNTQFAPLATLPQGIHWIIGAGSVAIVALCWWRCRLVGDADRQWSLVLSASLLLSPLGWVYYGVWLLPGLGFNWPGIAATAAWLIPTPYLIWGQPSPLATALWGSAATWGLLLAFLHRPRSHETWSPAHDGQCVAPEAQS